GQRMIVATNYATDDVRTRCEELGADAVFDKSRQIMDLVTYCQELAGIT
ncbi:MAG: response regulator, partial [Brachymonas sp.]|nr:response regulator [Brachymonas sp.]